ncbi:hypothetical protein AcW1_006739 [Taiwanofungus camphoratus]|nr:hypothetical protein AcV7_007328 [Antrodia cinnamomea]KAI0955030.1 hypothetical protein AcW1_006739 [Antrodia cinnamomea]
MGLAYYSTMIGLNVILTCLILGRILYLGRAVSITARKKCMARYTGTISMIVESALPYALSGIAWLVSYGIGSEISILFLSFYIMFTCISPQMIILQVVKGQAWSKEKAAESVLVLQTIRSTTEHANNYESSDTMSKLGGESHAGSLHAV